MLKTAYFLSAQSLVKFANDAANNVTSTVSITFDAGSGQFVLFYT